MVYLPVKDLPLGHICFLVARGHAGDDVLSW